MPLPRSALCLAVLVCGVDGFSLAPAVHGRRGLTSRVGSVVAVESWYDTGKRLTEDAKAHAAPVAEGASDGVSVPEACKFMADPTLEGMSVEDKSAFLASKGVDSFVIAQATCVTNEDNVQGHPELPAAEPKAAPVDDGSVGVPAACKFMADPTLEGMSVEDKSAFLASKGVDAFVIAQATCVTNEDNVQGHPELPAAEEKPAAATPAAGASSLHGSIAAQGADSAKALEHLADADEGTLDGLRAMVGAHVTLSGLSVSELNGLPMRCVSVSKTSAPFRIAVDVGGGRTVSVPASKIVSASTGEGGGSI